MINKEEKNKYKQKKNNHSGSSGFVALFTVLIASTIMLMIVGITSVNYKEALLTRGSTDSSTSFFASDTGIECALYYDRKVSAFPEIDALLPLENLNCQGIEAEINEDDALEYSFLLDSYLGWCADVRIDKAYLEDGVYYTKIESFGYNTRCGERGTSPKSVERALRVRYPNAVFVL